MQKLRYYNFCYRDWEQERDYTKNLDISNILIPSFTNYKSIKTYI